MSKGLGLLSGGLDSMLAAALLRRQGVEVTCIAFETPFFGAGRARKAAAALGIPLLVQEIGAPHLEMLKNPRYGYGRNLNPCIDCHAMMFRRAGRIMEAEGFDFIFSGEVLAQRPMSQNLSALQAVAKHSGYPKHILRPLSAQLLPITAMEEAGLVDREQLLDIQGRNRRRQAELARSWGIVEYPPSGGGCLLTEKSFTGRLRDLLTHAPDCTTNDIELLKIGRQFRLSPTSKLVLGRNQEHNELLHALAAPGDLLLRCADFSGPLGLLRGEQGAETVALAAALVAAYGKGKGEGQVRVLIWQGTEERILSIAPLDRAGIERCQIE